jgi:aryl-alcohol dehydrogenase-like predicted oxidoreductase
MKRRPSLLYTRDHNFDRVLTEAEAVVLVASHRALELGVNWIDTAAVYGMGHCF